MEGLVAILGLAGLGVMIWGVIFALRRIRRWDRTVTKGFWFRFGCGMAVFVLAIALTPPAPGTDPTASAPEQPPAAPPPSGDAASETAATSSAPEGVPADAQEATVQEIIDGDTVTVSPVAEGPVLAKIEPVDVRLLEIDTPETVHPSQPVQCFGEDAANHLRQLIPTSSTVWVQRDQELQDQYGRHLLYLWNADGTFVNLDMVKGGFAKATLYPPNDRYWDKINSAGNQARNDTVGLWDRCSHFGAPKHPPEPEPEPKPEPKPQPEPEPVQQCASGYSPCIPPYPPDLNCSDVSGPVRVTGSDPHGLDRDGDGRGCEG